MIGLPDSITPIGAALLAALTPPLVWIFAKDIADHRIPDPANLAVALLGFLRLLILDPARLAERSIDAALVGALLLSLRWGYRRWRGVTGLGLGDVKFLAAATFWTGLTGIAMLLLFASTTALAVLAVAALAGRRVGRSTRIPFGPFLVVGLVCALVLDVAAGAL